MGHVKIQKDIDCPNLDIVCPAIPMCDGYIADCSPQSVAARCLGIWRNEWEDECVFGGRSCPQAWCRFTPSGLRFEESGN